MRLVIEFVLFIYYSQAQKLIWVFKQKDFEKINGYSVLPKLLNNENAEIRALTCELIGTCAQNNPYCQTTLIASKILPLMFYKLDKDSSDEVRIKALFAISCNYQFCFLFSYKYKRIRLIFNYEFVVVLKVWCEISKKVNKN